MQVLCNTVTKTCFSAHRRVTSRVTQIVSYTKHGSIISAASHSQHHSGLLLSDSIHKAVWNLQSSQSHGPNTPISFKAGALLRNSLWSPADTMMVLILTKNKARCKQKTAALCAQECSGSCKQPEKHSQMLCCWQFPLICTSAQPTLAQMWDIV